MLAALSKPDPPAKPGLFRGMKLKRSLINARAFTNSCRLPGEGYGYYSVSSGVAEDHNCNNNGKSDSWLRSRSLFIKRMAINNIPIMKICWVVFFHAGLDRLKREHAMICLAHGAKKNSYCIDKNNKGICCIFGLPSSAVSVELSKQGACWARRETGGREHGSVRCQPSRACTRRFILGLFYLFFFPGVVFSEGV